jgi:hypothetical protein
MRIRRNSLLNSLLIEHSGRNQSATSGETDMRSLPSVAGRALAGATALLAAAIMATTSEADTPKIAVGTLTCYGHGGVGLIFGSKETLRCEFTSAVTGRKRHYAATITKVGLDIGIKGDSTLIWTVLGSTTDLPGGALEGTYGGLTAGAAIGIGGNANALVGGSNQSVILQPVSVEGQTGLNISAGVAGLTLRQSEH